MNYIKQDGVRSEAAVEWNVSFQKEMWRISMRSIMCQHLLVYSTLFGISFSASL